jgi:hypothetical protein
MSDMTEENAEETTEPSFYVTIQVNVTLKRSEMWPDGDGPDDPTETDVLALIRDEGGPVEILREWKRDHATLLRRFDRDGSGHLDEREWELARRTAHHQAKRRYRAGLEGLLGFTRRGATFRIAPCAPASWREFSLSVRVGTTSA